MNELTKTAMLGTAKASGVSLAERSQIGGTWDALALDPERELLLRAGADATMRLAGLATGPGIELVAPADPDEGEECSARVASLVQTLLQTKKFDLAKEAFELLLERKQRLPAWLIPDVLDLDGVELRMTALPLLGKRGLWMSQFQPQWKWGIVDDDTTLPEDAERIWEEGPQHERLGMLILARSNDPELARTWLDSVWKKERAEFRTSALGTFEVNLSIDDEPLLERALDDRAQGVRDQAVTLLAMLPESAYLARMRKRGEAIFKYTPPPNTSRLQSLVRSLTAKQSIGTFEVTTPTTLDDQWKHDNLPDPTEKYGKMMPIIKAIMETIPPSHWEKHWNATPHAILSALLADKDNWTTPLHALNAAAYTYGETGWVRPLWDAWTSPVVTKEYRAYNRSGPMQKVLAILDDTERKAFIEEHVRNLDDEGIGEAIVNAMPQPWSEAFTHSVLEFIFKYAESKPNDYYLATMLTTTALAMPPHKLPSTVDRTQRFLERKDSYQLRGFLETLEIRERIYKEIDR